MYHKHHTKGIIISGRIEGDSNRRVSLLTEDFGLINAKVRGARNSFSKLRGGSQDFSAGEFSLVHGKSGWGVVSVRSEKNFFESLRNSQTKLKVVGNIFGLIKKLVSGEEADTILFNTVLNFLNFLTKAEEKDIALAECLTLTRILHSLGYMRHDPELLIPLSSAEIATKDLEAIAPKRAKMVQLINESLKTT